MKLLYFAWVREKVGTGSEDLALPDGVGTVADLVAWLKDKGAGYTEAFGNDGLVRVAVNQVHVQMDAPVADGDEVAFFPPVTGG